MKILTLYARAQNMKTIDFDKTLMNLAIEYLTRYAKSEGHGGRDSTILASLERHKIETLFTHTTRIYRCL